MNDARRTGKAGLIALLLVLAVGAGVYVWPQLVRVAGTQPPVGADVRDSLLGLGRVLQLHNQGKAALVNVVVEATNPAHNTHASHRFDRMDPGETMELGWREWGWSVDPGETYTISANDYPLSITFSSAQLGVN